MSYVPYNARYFNKQTGFLLPRLTTAQRDAIDTSVAPYGGWLVFNLDTQIIEVLTQDGWVPATLGDNLTGSGDVVLQSSPTIISPAIESPTLSGTVVGAATIPNSVLENSSITIAGHEVNLGGSQSLAAADLTDGTLGSGNIVLSRAGCVSETSNYALATTDSGKFFNNIGATGAVNFNLPAASAGLNYYFIVETAQNVVITAGAGSIISMGSAISASGGNATSSVPYSAIHVVAISTTEWVAVSSTGEWTVT